MQVDFPLILLLVQFLVHLISGPFRSHLSPPAEICKMYQPWIFYVESNTSLHYAGTFLCEKAVITFWNLYDNTLAQIIQPSMCYDNIWFMSKSNIILQIENWNLYLKEELLVIFG